MARKAKVDVNRADRDELAAVPGIGRSTADAMVKARFERGGFKRLDELAEVPGIGEQTLEGLRKHVTVSTNGEARAETAKKPATNAEKGVEATRRGADKTVASAAKAAETGANAARKSAAAQAEVQAESAEVVQRSAQEQVASAHARQRETVQTAASSGNAVFETVREANQAWLGFVQDQFWANVQTAQMLARCRSPQDVLEVQRTYVRSSMERLAEEQARFANLATRMATRTARPAR